MAYTVLYRKYRPKAFSDVVGQEQVTETLKSELKAGRIAHAYLFTGSRGTGKTTCSKIMAKAVNCLNLQDGDPCGVCENCVGIDNGTLMDVMEIDAASNNKVEDIRSLIEEVAYTPAKAKFRVYIIDEVHELSAAAFNAMLKTLEEPPEHAVFILATTEVHKLLPTILSRCQRFDFRRITPEDIAGRLEYIAEKEGVSIEHDAAIMIAQIADGGMRDAISILDQCIGRSHEIDVDVVSETAGIVGKEHLFEITDAVLKCDCASCIDIIAKLHEKSKDLSKLCEEIINHFRQMMLIKTKGNYKNMVVMSAKEFEKIENQAVSTNLSVIIHCLDTFAKTLDKMKYSNQRIEMEMAFVRLCSPELDNSPDALVRRIEALESRKMPVMDIKQAMKQESAKPSEEPIKATVPSEIEKLSENAVAFDRWPDVIHIIKEYSKTVGTAFASSQAYTSGNYMLVDGSDIAFEYLRKNPQYKDKLREAIFMVTEKSYKLGPYKGKQKNGKKEEVNPCDMLAQKAEEAGIEVNIKE